MKEKAEKTSKEQALEMQIKLLKEALDNKDKTISRLEIENADLKAQLARRYRRTSEAISSDQLMLFNEAELGVEDGVLNDKSEDLPEDDNAADSNPLGDRAKRKYTKRKSEYTMLSLPADTPVTVIHEEVQAPVCEACGAVKVKVGERVHDTVVKTTSYSIVRRVTDVYECPRCDGSAKGTPKTDNILENTVVDPLMLADILNSKFNMGVPLYRQQIVESTMTEGVSVIRSIEPKKKEETNTKKKLRVAAYCRVSKDIEEQESSLATQMSTYNRIISQHPDWELVELYKDKGKTGTNTKKRLDFNRMLDDAKEGNIDLILVKSVSRFSRNTIDLLEYHTLSKRNGYLFLLTTYKKQNPPKTSVIDGLRNIY